MRPTACLPVCCTDAADVTLGAQGAGLTRTTGVRRWSSNPQWKQMKKKKKRKSEETFPYGIL